MSDVVKIAVDAMGGDNSPKKIINGIIHNHNKNEKQLIKIMQESKKIRKKIVSSKQDVNLPDFGRR